MFENKIEKLYILRKKIENIFKIYCPIKYMFTYLNASMNFK